MNFSISETQLRNLISGYMKVKEDDVQDIYQIRKGMTNQSYHFCVDNREYLLRIPGKGTQKIIDRRKEAEIVAQLQDLDICDEVVVIDPESGILIKAYYPDSRTADDHNREDLALCMQKLKQLHRLHLTSSFRFELFEEIKRYEELTGVSEFPKEMQLLREKIFSFQPFIEAHTYTRCLCHIDAVKDNFLLHDGKVHLIDWEYAGDADPHLDLAMFSVYSNYSPKELNQLISLYMEGPFPEYIAAKIYGYASACALLWYYWCIIREKSGVRFDEYKRQEYDYAFRFAQYAEQKISSLTRHTVQQAIILAAGKGERLFPLTEQTPKPLLSVCGKPMIESIIDALHYNGIKEIYIVTGYKKECFAYLKKDPGIHLIENPYYASANNISSLYVVRGHLEDTVILDGDQVIFDTSVCSASFEGSGYRCVWTDKPTKEWVLDVNDCGAVQACHRNGADHGWQLYSISYWTKEDGRKLAECVQKKFEEEQNSQLYWDDLALFCYPHRFQLCVYPMLPDSMKEIDTLEEYERFCYGSELA